jgi:hypothetical protein
VSNPGRREIARSLRAAGNHEAALAVLLDYKPTNSGAASDDNGDESAAAAANMGTAAEPVFTMAELRSLDVAGMTKLESTPEGKAALKRSLEAAKAGA